MDPVVNASLLLSLADRATGLAGPSAMHPDAWRLGERVDAWARARGLVLGDPDTSPLGRARCERLAARLFPAAEADRVELFACWLTWAFALDDTLDRPPVAGSGSTVHAVYDDLLRAMRRGHAGPGARPLEATLVELWGSTAERMSREWRRRFLAHLEEHRTGRADQAVHRRTRRMPGPDEYPPLRRRACGPFLYDLIEPVLGVELPNRLLALPAWQFLLEGTADVIAWSNDLASYSRESALGEVYNHVIVLSAAYDIEPARACDWVADRIALLVEEVRAAARTVAATLDRLRLSDGEREAARQVSGVLLAAPRAHIDWITESGRYSPSEGSSEGYGGSGGARLDGLASLR
ncbi:hypothetical protein GCM10023085_76950 [Actinomadura viridis]|uniref:Terpene synthase n=1 Tax=Actinomadura viridis TaxID=58110 RepID=A0A931DG75_9ACTN|nr:terpene synthase family protein [Actinomadura viridis]MBG6088209.1 hypothetical protein [Actinomadura viridis]